MNLRDHSIGRMMALLIALLAEQSTLEVHVFGPGRDGRGGGGGSGTSNGNRTEEEATEKRSDDPVVDALRSAVRHWHQVLVAPEIVTAETEECWYTLLLVLNSRICVELIKLTRRPGGQVFSVFHPSQYVTFLSPARHCTVDATDLV